MTSDGISPEDWTRVTVLMAEIVNLSYHERYEAAVEATHELLDLIASLQEKYGPLPRLLATRAAYVMSSEEREYWLLAAYRAAEQWRDVATQAWAAFALAAYYVETVADDAEGVRWLSLADDGVRAFPDELVAEDLERLRAILARRHSRRSGVQPRDRRPRRYR